MTPGSPPPPEVTTVKLRELAAYDNIRELDKGSSEFKELVEDVKTRGVIEPVIVRPRLDTTAPYELVAGFRRTAAAHEAKLLEIPARVLSLTDDEVAEIRLIENLQRKNLSPMDEGRAFAAYLARGNVSAKHLAGRISKSASYVSSRIGLTKLPAQVQKWIENGKLPVSHAELLAKLPADDQGAKAATQLAQQALQWPMTVPEFSQRVGREAETIAAQRKFQSERDQSEHPKCPKCQEPAKELAPSWTGLRGYFLCPKEHAWSIKTGKLYEPRKTSASGGHGGAMGHNAGIDAAERAQETRQRNEDNLSESPVLRAGQAPMAILLALLKDVGADRIARIHVTGEDGYGEPSIKILLTEGRAPMGLGGGHETTLVPGDYSTGHRSAFVADAVEAEEKQATKKRIAAWLKANVPPLKEAKAKAPPLNDAQVAEILNGSVEEVVKRLPDDGVRDGKVEDPAWREKLELLRDAEVEGKCRGGVLEAIDRELGVRGENAY